MDGYDAMADGGARCRVGIDVDGDNVRVVCGWL